MYHYIENSKWYPVSSEKLNSILLKYSSLPEKVKSAPADKRTLISSSKFVRKFCALR